MSGAKAGTSKGQKVKRGDVVGAVLAGGGSVRMGSPKHALVMPDGRMMIEHVVDALRAVCADVVVLGPDDVLPDLPHVCDLRADAGPLAGIEALLGSESAGAYLVCPCDLPLMTGALLQRLLTETTDLVTVFRVEGRERLESLPMRVSGKALAAVRQCLDADRRSVQGFIESAGYETVLIDEQDARQLTNINTPEQYAAVAARRTASRDTPHG